jgi:hypothetical protein
MQLYIIFTLKFDTLTVRLFLRRLFFTYIYYIVDTILNAGVAFV